MLPAVEPSLRVEAGSLASDLQVSMPGMSREVGSRPRMASPREPRLGHMMPSLCIEKAVLGKQQLVMISVLSSRSSQLLWPTSLC